MNDTDIAARIRQSLRRNAEHAPSATGLAEAVQRRAARRGIRGWIIGIVSGAGAVAAAFLLPAALAQPGFGEALATHRIDVCAAGTGDPQLWIVDRVGDGTVEAAGSQGTSPTHADLTVAEPGYEVNVGVHPPTDDASQLEQVRDITVDGHDGRIGVSEGTGSAVARIDSGVERFTIVVALREGTASIAELSDWVATFDIHDTTAPCEEIA